MYPFGIFIRNSLELIETLWNVNKLMVGSAESLAPELIETLWNVNDGATIVSSSESSN